MKKLLDLKDPKVEKLNNKIKEYLNSGTLYFTLDEEGKLVAMGDFAGGMDTIGDDNYSICSWDDFIEHS